MSFSIVLFMLAAIIVSVSSGTMAGLAVYSLARPNPFTDAERCLITALGGLVVALLAAGSALTLIGF